MTKVAQRTWFSVVWIELKNLPKYLNVYVRDDVLIMHIKFEQLGVHGRTLTCTPKSVGIRLDQITSQICHYFE